jgi:hypothetical protein
MNDKNKPTSAMILQLVQDLRGLGYPVCDRAADEIQRLDLEVSLPSFKASLPWQPMDTAPQDKPIILTEDSGDIFTGYWRDGLGWLTGYTDEKLHIQVSLNPIAWSPMVKGPEWSDQPAQGRPKDGHSPNEAGHE